MNESTLKVVNLYKELFTGWSLSNEGITWMERLVDQFSCEEVVDAMTIASIQYVIIDENGFASDESVAEAMDKLGGILYNRRNHRNRYYRKDRA